MEILRKIYRKVQRKIFNNILVNQLLIVIGADYLPKKQIKNWKALEYDPKASVLENSGITEVPEIWKTLDHCHTELNHVYKENLHGKGRILDIGCGPGLFLNDFKDSKDEIWGIDMNPDFIRKAKELVPSAHILEGNFLQTEIPGKFALIYASSVLMYIEKSKIKLFFDKIYNLLQEGGIVFIHYPHALRRKDLWYHDLSYIRYSPAFLESILGKRFQILKHEHMYDGRKVGRYDSFHYYYPDGKNNRLDTLQNTFMLIAKKEPL